MSFILQWGVANSQYAGDFGVKEFETEADMEAHVETAKRSAFTLRSNDDGELATVDIKLWRAGEEDAHIHAVDCHCGDCEEAIFWRESDGDGQDWICQEIWFLRPDPTA